MSSFISSEVTVFSSTFSSEEFSPLKSPEISSPSSPIIANNLSTGEVSPSCTPICNKTPS